MKGRDIKQHAQRFAKFGAIGGAVFLFGLAIQVVAVEILNLKPVPAYLAQAFVSIELSYILNWKFTWADRHLPFWGPLWKFNTQKWLMTVPNLGLYWLFIWTGMQYVVANLMVTAIFTTANYLISHYWSLSAMPEIIFRSCRISSDPTVSVIIPCKKNERTIRATVESLLGQDYAFVQEVILVGDRNDSTWSVLDDITDPRLILLEQMPKPGKRDPAIKRARGVRYARGELLAFADSDIVMDSDWLSRGVKMLKAQDGGCVAGGMKSIRDTFWGRFVDANILSAKTPRIPAPYEVTKYNFGSGKTKPPIGANIIMTRDVYQQCPIDTSWTHGYEDYEWFWRIARESFRIHFSSELDGAHHHRNSFVNLRREYMRAAEGCAYFIGLHPDAPLATKRKHQAYLLPLAALIGAAATGVLISRGYIKPLVLTGLAGAMALSAREFVNTRRIESLIYPPISLALAGIFALNLTYSMAIGRGRSMGMPGPDQQSTDLIPMYQSQRHSRLVSSLAFGLIIAAGVSLRLWQLGTKPNWQMDEVTYTAIGTNVMKYRSISLPLSYHEPWRPFLFHPPFYFILLGKWFSLVGASVYHARILGVLFTAVSFALISLFVYRTHGRQAALFSVLFLAFDGWLLYVQRVSYMENVLLALIAVLLLVYLKAMKIHEWRWYLAAGLAAGACSIFKHVGMYVLLLLAISWLLKRKDTWKHLAMMVTAATIITAYTAMMVYELTWLVPDPSWFHRQRLVETGGHNWFLEDTTTQLRRVLGFQHSGGSLNSFSEFWHLVTSQYDVFVPSLLVALTALIWLTIIVVRAFWKRSSAEFGVDTIIPAWALAGVISFGLIALKYSQYFSLVLIPLYLFMWTRLWPKIKTRQWLMAGLAACVIAGGMSTYMFRVMHSYRNAYGSAAVYVDQHVPKNALVIADPPISYEISQQRCSFNGRFLSYGCRTKSSYIVTWQTYLQSANPYGYKPLAQLLSRSTQVASFQSFNGVARIWRINGVPTCVGAHCTDTTHSHLVRTVRHLSNTGG